MPKVKLLKKVKSTPFDCQDKKLASVPGFKLKNGSIVIPEMIASNNGWRDFLYVQFLIMIVFAIGSLWDLVRMGTGEVSKAPMFFVLNLCVPLALFILYWVSIKTFSGLRFFVLNDKEALIVSRKKYMKYPVESINFCLLKLDEQHPVYTIEVEIPESQIPGKDRLILIDMSQDLEFIEARLNSIIDELSNKGCIHKSSVEPKKLISEKLEFCRGPWRSIIVLLRHCNIKYLYQGFSRWMFRQVHGSAKRALKKVSF